MSVIVPCYFGLMFYAQFIAMESWKREIRDRMEPNITTHSKASHHEMYLIIQFWNENNY